MKIGRQINILCAKMFLNRGFQWEQMQERKLTIFLDTFKSLNILPKMVEIITNCQEMKDLPELNELCQNTYFQIIDYLPCICKIPIQIGLGHFFYLLSSFQSFCCISNLKLLLHVLRET